MIFLSIEYFYFGVWLSLVERLVRDQEAAGSNPVTPTSFGSPYRGCCFFAFSAAGSCGPNQFGTKGELLKNNPVSCFWGACNENKKPKKQACLRRAATIFSEGRKRWFEPGRSDQLRQSLSGLLFFCLFGSAPSHMENKMIFMKGKQPLSAHFPKLLRKPAALHSKIILKLLP